MIKNDKCIQRIERSFVVLESFAMSVPLEPLTAGDQRSNTTSDLHNDQCLSGLLYIVAIGERRQWSGQLAMTSVTKIVAHS